MTRKDYRKIAEILNKYNPSTTEPYSTIANWEGIVREIGKMLEDDDPRFDWGRWNRACGKISIHPKTTLEKGV